MLSESADEYLKIWSNRLDTTRAAQYLNLSVKKLSEWRYRKIGPPYYKLLGRVYYDKQALEQWFKENLQRYE